MKIASVVPGLAKWLLLAAFVPSSLVARQDGTVVSVSANDGVTALRLSPDEADRINVDGYLDDAVWANAPVMSGLRQTEPSEGEAATERTEIRVLYGRSHLYVGIMAYDRQPDDIIARILQRDRVMQMGFGDPEFAGDDAIAILLDPFHDHRNGVVFATNPNGAKFDALLTDEGREFNIDWRAVWDVAAQRTPQGWSAEFSIPFRTLRYPVDTDQPWGFNVYRVIRRKNEEVLLASWSRGSEGFTRVSRASHLNGLVDLPRSGLNMEVKPYVLMGAEQEQPDEDVPIRSLGTEGELDLGVDVKYEVRPGLTLDATVNTDFAQVEVDDQQVNLTRFSLFFPEKRDFFLENAGVFEFGWRSFFEPPPFLLFFSRQIGINEDGAVPVIGGGRLTGRVGRQTLGLINVVTDEAFGEPRTNFAAARFKRDIGGSNFVGAMMTDRRNSDASNTTAGADFSFWPGSSFNVQGFVAATTSSGSGGEGVAYRAGVDYQKDKFGITAGHMGITDGVEADLGFVTRTDITRTDAFARVTPRPQVLGLRKIDVFWNAQLITRTDMTLQDWTLGPAFSPEWESGENLTVWTIRGFTRLDEGFDFSDDVPVPAGDYNTTEIGWFFNTSRNRPVSLGSMGTLQWIYDGTVHSVGADLDLVPSSNLAVTAGISHNVVKVPSGEFTADIIRGRFQFAFSTNLTANALIQYNTESQRLASNVRINFIHRPGSDVFIVFNEDREFADAFTFAHNRAAVVKITYLARF